jgi:hypothetical protein
MESTARVCAACTASLDEGAAFCSACGRAVEGPGDMAGAAADAVPGSASGDPPAPPPAPARADNPAAHFGRSLVEGDRTRRIRRASRWLAITAVLFAAFGTIYGLQARSQAGEAHAQLAQFDPAESVELEGEVFTVPELARQIDREVVLVFGVNYFLALVMLGLFFWSRRTPFPAMVTGLCVYLGVIVLSAVYEPKTLTQGIIVKAIFIAALIAGIKAALAERDAQRSGVEPA